MQVYEKQLVCCCCPDIGLPAGLDSTPLAMTPQAAAASLHAFPAPPLHQLPKLLG